MSNRKKDRIFVGIYYRQSITSNPASIELGPARFHWAIWVEPKASKGNGTCYQVQEMDSYVNIPDSGGWQFNIQHENYQLNNGMMGRFMVGKLPHSVSHEVLKDVLSQVPLPRTNVEPIENCVSWTAAALKELQERGSVEKFDTGKFADHVVERATSWVDRELYPGDNQFENYTKRKF